MNLCCRFSTKRISAVCFNAEVFLNLPGKSPKARVRRLPLHLLNQFLFQQTNQNLIGQKLRVQRLEISRSDFRDRQGLSSFRIISVRN